MALPEMPFTIGQEFTIPESLLFAINQLIQVDRVLAGYLLSHLDLILWGFFCCIHYRVCNHRLPGVHILPIHDPCSPACTSMAQLVANQTDLFQSSLL